MKLSPELEEICNCNNLDHTTLNYLCPANEESDFDLHDERWDNGDLCPICGQYTLYSDAPDDAPDFLCPDCHDVMMDEDEDWREETLKRKNRQESLDEEWKIVLDVYTSCPNECGEKHIPIIYEAIKGHDPMYILDCGKCGFLDDDWDPKYVYEKEDGQIIKYYRESSDFDVVPMHPSLRNAEEALDYEGVEDQAVMFDIINMVEANDLWNEIVFELIARGDAVRRPDGKIIFTDQAPQYDIIEDIAEYTSSQFEFNADGDIK